MTRAELDKMIERWLKERRQCSVDFEIDDAVNKLQALELVSESDSKLSAVSLKADIKALDKCWDDYFVA